MEEIFIFIKEADFFTWMKKWMTKVATKIAAWKSIDRRLVDNFRRKFINNSMSIRKKLIDNSKHILSELKNKGVYDNKKSDQIREGAIVKTVNSLENSIGIDKQVEQDQTSLSNFAGEDMLKKDSWWKGKHSFLLVNLLMLFMNLYLAFSCLATNNKKRTKVNEK